MSKNPQVHTYKISSKWAITYKYPIWNDLIKNDHVMFLLRSDRQVTWPSSHVSLQRLQTSQTVKVFFLDYCRVPSDKTPPLFKEATAGWWEKTSSHVQLLLSVFHRETVQQFLYDGFSPCLRTTVTEVSLTPWQKPLRHFPGLNTHCGEYLGPVLGLLNLTDRGPTCCRFTYLLVFKFWWDLRNFRTRAYNNRKVPWIQGPSVRLCVQERSSRSGHVQSGLTGGNRTEPPLTMCRHE